MNPFSRVKLLFQLQSALGKFQNAWKNLINDKETIQMLTIGQIFKSKTVWTNILAAAIAGYNVVQGNLPHSVTEVITTATPLLTLVWKIFSTKQVPSTT